MPENLQRRELKMLRRSDEKNSSYQYDRFEDLSYERKWTIYINQDHRGAR
ncbi:Uncharacterised protein [Grimontia hollisae]|nr:Uncharacterised protein [Grimontia hollisae]